MQKRGPNPGRFWLSSLALAVVTPLFVLSAHAQAAPQPITEFPVGPTLRNPTAITLGPEGSLWFGGGEQVGRMTPSGQFSEFSLPGPANRVPEITTGSDGNLWFIYSGGLGRMTPDGQLTRFELPHPEKGTGEGFRQLRVGADGYLWATIEISKGNEVVGGAIDRIAPSGQLTKFPLPSGAGAPHGITQGPEGAMWFSQKNEIGRIRPNGEVTEFPLPSVRAPLSRSTGAIAEGSDGNLWFPIDIDRGYEADPEYEARIARMSPSGQITEFPLPSAEDHAHEIALGPDGNVWFTDERGLKPPYAGVIGRITPWGQVTEFPPPARATEPWSIVAGSESVLWFTDRAEWMPPGGIGRVTTGVPGIEISSATAAASRRGTKVRLACGGTPAGGCRGTLTLSFEVQSHRLNGDGPATILLARRHFAVSPEAARLVSLPLTPRARRLLSRHRHMRVTAAASMPEGQGMSRDLILRSAARHRRWP